MKLRVVPIILFLAVILVFPKNVKASEAGYYWGMDFLGPDFSCGPSGAYYIFETDQCLLAGKEY
ncbi:MAG TPA: hypothetical protein P5080_00295 [Candidatus Paceibacterota bacterium]|nr:hypothetical protein [Candidatus Pacearchaeota archaeon]HRZ50414.1 hypothetical protein [Candidatus Paceibacterota bacterium]HSA36135.1 hypothetical protein [Candidatus Paceibacterota bacterium]